MSNLPPEVKTSSLFLKEVSGGGNTIFQTGIHPNMPVKAIVEELDKHYPPATVTGPNDIDLHKKLFQAGQRNVVETIIKLIKKEQA